MNLEKVKELEGLKDQLAMSLAELKGIKNTKFKVVINAAFDEFNAFFIDKGFSTSRGDFDITASFKSFEIALHCSVDDSLVMTLKMSNIEHFYSVTLDIPEIKPAVTIYMGNDLNSDDAQIRKAIDDTNNAIKKAKGEKEYFEKAVSIRYKVMDSNDHSSYKTYENMQKILETLFN